jgi:hypothetical protein
MVSRGEKNRGGGSTAYWQWTTGGCEVDKWHRRGLLIGGIQMQNGPTGSLHMGVQGIASSARARCSRTGSASEQWQLAASAWSGRGAAHLVACTCPGGSWP